MRVVPLALFTLCILVGGSWPTRGGRPGYSDKLLHAVVFGSLVPVGYVAFAYFTPDKPWPRRLGYALLYSVALGGLLEIWQGLLKYRSQELLDWVADIFGALVGAALVAVYVKLSRATRGSPWM